MSYVSVTLSTSRMSLLHSARSNGRTVTVRRVPAHSSESVRRRSEPESMFSQESHHRLLPKFLDGHVLLRILLHDLGHGHLEVLLIDVHPPLSESVHAGLGTDSLPVRGQVRSGQVSPRLRVKGRRSRRAYMPASVQTPCRSEVRSGQ